MDINIEEKQKKENFYGTYYLLLRQMEEKITRWIEESVEGEIEHMKSRIKSSESTKNKLMRLGYEPNLSNAQNVLTDIIGIRIICRFWDDVYKVASYIEESSEYMHKVSKDYILSPKPNGYRSYHIIIIGRVKNIEIPIEIQIRTISQDSWASLEHKLKYKQDIKNEKLVKRELKRLADEMVSVDLCMQAIKEVIEEEIDTKI